VPSFLFLSLKFLFFLSEKRTFLDDDTVVVSTVLEAEESCLAVIMVCEVGEKRKRECIEFREEKLILASVSLCK
jgi:hypothetical protein